MSESRVTVVVPTIGDRDAYLAACLRSIASQSSSRIDKICVVDASGSARASLPADLENDPRVCLVPSDHALLAGQARQLGTDLATSELVAFCDDDDLWAPDKLALQLDAMAATNSQWCACGAVAFRQAAEAVYAEWLPERANVRRMLLDDNAIPGGGSGVVVAKALIDRVGGWSSELRNAEDWHLWIRLAEVGEPAYVHRPLVGYRVHDTNKSGDIERQMQVRAQILHSVGKTVDARWVRDWMLFRLIRAERYGEARREVHRLDPTTNLFHKLALRVVLPVVPRLLRRTLQFGSIARAPRGWIREAERWVAMCTEP